MAYNKATFNNGTTEETIFDLTEDTVQPSSMLLGVTAHDSNNTAITGTLVPVLSVNNETPDAQGNVDVVALPSGGTAGQILTKISSTDGDADWETASIPSSAVDIDYVNTMSGLASTDVQNAIDEVAGSVAQNQSDIQDIETDIEDINTTMTTSNYYNHESTIAWVPNTSVVGSDYSGMNIKNGFVSVQINFFTASALTSGTEYTIYTLPDALKALTGNTQVHSVGLSDSVAVRLCFNTWDSNVITIIPRGAIPKSKQITGNIMFPVT